VVWIASSAPRPPQTLNDPCHREDNEGEKWISNGHMLQHPSHGLGRGGNTTGNLVNCALFRLVTARPRTISLPQRDKFDNLSTRFFSQIRGTSTFSEVTMFSKFIQLLHDKDRTTAIDHALAAFLIAMAAVEVMA
jgi:hypothetical protein